MLDGNGHAKITAANADLHLAGGVTYQMAPLSDKDIAELDQWVKLEYIALALASLSPDHTHEDEIATRVQASRVAMNMSWMSGEGAHMMATVDGLARLVWQSVKRNHPEVTLSELRRHMFSPDNIREVRLKFNHLNAGDEVPSKNPRRRRRRKPKRRAATRGRKRTGN